ncbi:hypothetical protein N7465_006537 [Penicillium sp. CMV-2018d]|nr:hypothetical protein N7465_006537 [Penicillium sp. CMV-2018d]
MGLPTLTDPDEKWKKFADHNKQEYNVNSNVVFLAHTQDDESGLRPSPTPAQPTFVTSETHIQTTLPSAGGVEEIVYQMTDSISPGRIKAMRRNFHQTCPGD